MTQSSLLEIHGLRKSFARPDGGELLVLDGIELSLQEGEIIGLLGRSGSGKSTLLRLIAGLSQPVAGTISYLGQDIVGPPLGIAMVFQGFALFPWLTVLQNVELGLEALGLPSAEIRKRSLEAIDLIGLDGFESAFPRELSGGMRQRVGFARALVVHPNILLMDEPFSALDVLTAETLRSDLLDLWANGQLPIKGIILVSHNIEEAVLMCDRILVFGSDPGRILDEIKVTLPRPRDRLDPGFRDLVENIYLVMTARLATDQEAPRHEHVGAGLDTVLPHISSNLLAGLVETVGGAPYNGQADLPVIAALLHMEIDDLFPIAETLQMLRFADVGGGDIKLNSDGMRFMQANTDERKHLFAQHLMAYVGLAGHVRHVLDERPSHTASWSRFSDELEDHMAPAAARQTMRAIISWGRYAEIFAYDDHTHMFSLENPGAV
ncbi:ABC transporter ATP-binding protein [Govanella unica]|uniref:Nitrate/sulfonate/bicarbonate ABC transporter ATP-binding protein n=1 Tax=Govanella unica TaxID=2975056 RepID=A0A9X3Z7V3_9PROT|nr:nitrate/sulfonate/bicarbonate ABC transporter ATP-binding protein [Govania unica]MDA5194536.1 nitrate/sulfonate/bicarbonate ABC transporter ATP-binding protein [Govania unica]